MRINRTKLFRGSVTAYTELRQAQREIGGGLEKLPRLAGRKPKSDHTPTAT